LPKIHLPKTLKKTITFVKYKIYPADACAFFSHNANYLFSPIETIATASNPKDGVSAEFGLLLIEA
jgi:hypothetical protein